MRLPIFRLARRRSELLLKLLPVLPVENVLGTAHTNVSLGGVLEESYSTIAPLS